MKCDILASTVNVVKKEKKRGELNEKCCIHDNTKLRN